MSNASQGVLSVLGNEDLKFGSGTVLSLRQLGLLDCPSGLDSSSGCNALERFPSWSIQEIMGLGTQSTCERVGPSRERLESIGTIFPVNKRVAGRAFVATVRGAERALVIVDGLETPCC